jgi:hypothetical protein
MKRFLYIFMALLMIIFGCSVKNEEQTSTKELSKELSIGVVGAPPSLKRPNVSFRTLSLREVKSNERIDALFIMPEHLEEAAQPEYADLYKSLPYPTFWIDSQKPYYAFTDAEFTYENAPGSFEDYAYGYLNLDKNQIKGWAIKLKNNKKTKENIEEAYDIIFDIISKN